MNIEEVEAPQKYENLQTKPVLDPFKSTAEHRKVRELPRKMNIEEVEEPETTKIYRPNPLPSVAATPKLRKFTDETNIQARNHENSDEFRTQPVRHLDLATPAFYYYRKNPKCYHTVWGTITVRTPSVTTLFGESDMLIGISFQGAARLLRGDFGMRPGSRRRLESDFSKRTSPWCMYNLIAQQVLKTTSWCVGRSLGQWLYVPGYSSNSNQFQQIQWSAPWKCDIVSYMVAFLFDSFPLHPWTVGIVKLVPCRFRWHIWRAGQRVPVTRWRYVVWTSHGQPSRFQRWERRCSGIFDTDLPWSSHILPKRNKGFLEDCPLPWKFTRVAIGTRTQSLIGTWLLREHNKGSAWKQVSWERWRTWNPSTWNDMLIRPLHKLW